MKKLLLATTAFAAMGVSAFAADLPRRAAPPVFTPVPVFTWTGFYAGFNAGYAFNTGRNSNINTVTVTDPTVATPGAVVAYGNRDQDGFSGGGQVGYNYQFTPGSGVVIGIEADAQYLDFGRDKNRYAITPGAAVNGNLVFVDPRGTSSLDFFGTVRGRIGYAFDRTLVYGTGGFAYASGDDRRLGIVGGNDSFRTGYAVGGGIEYALPTDSFLNFFRSNAVTLKVEGLYVNLDRKNNTAGIFAYNPTTGATYSAAGFRTRDTEFAVVRAGLNYKFGTY